VSRSSYGCVRGRHIYVHPDWIGFWCQYQVRYPVGRAIYFLNYSVLSASGVSLAASSSYVMCCTSDAVDVVLVLTACMFIGRGSSLTLMCRIDRSNALYLLRRLCLILPDVTYTVVLMVFPFAAIVAVNCPETGNGGEPYGFSVTLHFVSFGFGVSVSYSFCDYVCFSARIHFISTTVACWCLDTSGVVGWRCLPYQGECSLFPGETVV